MSLGPVDVYIIAFPENRFSGEIVPAIQQQVQAGVIRILDVLFVMKDAQGITTTLAISDLGSEGAHYASLELHAPGSLDTDDADEISEDLPHNSSALLIAYENTWMSDVVAAFANAGAVVIDQIRIPTDAVDQVITR